VFFFFYILLQKFFTNFFHLNFLILDAKIFYPSFSFVLDTKDFLSEFFCFDCKSFLVNFLSLFLKIFFFQFFYCQIFFHLLIFFSLNFFSRKRKKNYKK